jgi:hypothetical protein
MSSDGFHQTAVTYGDKIYVSTNYGDTWTPEESNRYWSCVAMSSDGLHQTAATTGGQIYVRTAGAPGCTQDSNCSYLNTECKTGICSSGTCIAQFNISGTPCSQGTCDGYGNCEPIYQAEDINTDGIINILDLILVAKDIGRADCNTGNNRCNRRDVNNDSRVDIIDLVRIAKKI